MIDLHIINKDNKYIAFQPESLGIFLVSEYIGKALKSYEPTSKDYNPMISKETNPGVSIHEIAKYFSDKAKINTAKDLKWEDKEPKTLCLLISQDCNLRCSYCFADHGTFGGEKKLMSQNTAKNCVNKLLSKDFDNYVIFFGGEPFLNFPLMEAIKKYGHQAKLAIKYTTITNGTVVNDPIEKFISETLFSICISLDGPKEINDIQRYYGPESVHDQVIMTLDRFKSKKIPLSINCTVTKKSISKLEYIAEYFGSLGVNSMAFIPVARIPQESELMISDNEFEVYAKKLSSILSINLNQIASGSTKTVVSPNFDILMQLLTKTRIIHHCSAGREYLAVTADGDVYPCHEFVGMDEFNMGNVNDEDFPGDAYYKIKAIFSNHSVYVCEECNSCWARFLCGGDCVVRSYMNGDLFRPTKRKCILIKSILESLLLEIAEVFQDKTKMQNLMNQFNECKHHDGIYNTS